MSPITPWQAIVLWLIGTACAMVIGLVVIIGICYAIDIVSHAKNKMRRHRERRDWIKRAKETGRYW